MVKKLLFLLIILSLFIISIHKTKAANPTPITNCAELQAINTDAISLSGDYIQTTDISCLGVWDFTPIGSNTTPFTGTYDGNNKQITDFSLNKGSDDYVGLFGFISGNAKIQNVILKGGWITGGANTGGLVGEAGLGTEIDNVTIWTGVMGVTNVGGLVGVNSGNISNSKTEGAIANSDDNGNVGGLVGLNQGTANISNSDALGAIGNNGNAGGLVGACINWTGTITNSVSTGAVQGTNSAGGFIGTISVSSNGMVTKSHSLGAVNLSSSGVERYVGGFVGLNNGILDQVYGVGAVGGAGDSFVSGGIAGRNNNHISNTYHVGAVDGDIYSGGIAGINTGSISNTYATNFYNANGVAGGIVATNSGTVTNSYYNSINMPFSDGGTPKDYADLLLQSTYQPGDSNNWDFNQIWKIDSGFNDGLPFFQWQNLPVSDGTSGSIQNDVIDKFISVSGDVDNSSQATFNVDYTINTGQSTITFPSGTNLTASDGGNFDFSSFSANTNTSDSQSQLNNVINSVKLGLLNESVLFSNPITISLYVGDSYNGQTLTVYSESENSSSWNFQTTCIVSGGYCTFETNHATTFAALGSSTSNSSSNDNSSSGGSGGESYSCTDLKPSSIPDLFQINTNGTTAKLFFTPIQNTTRFYISFSTKLIAEEHGVLVDLAREGVQNFTINFLKPNTVYYFKVRGQNGCMSGEWSGILRASTRQKSVTKTKSFYKYILVKNKLIVAPAH